ncbi:hypothetical protein SAMN02745168_1513 [Papillibacter cinnamivorans DSM 12816]|uniref:Cof subfamily of IIB subfamily of haloacid dehalogenase superfamily/HAD-superfamily hydrolase, subfamily IIB n=1 Tax=Papillibacter cinnamivorans DSM 12816 TaxID=1122930 RepID=A0A1W2A630_9FIRM|nr:hypothetical protein SAMN02745168_1513 [Papillibacter cinnamivorans DSM 12816]
MGKFDGVLLASDFDDTLLNSNLEVSRENRDAIRYFMERGGRFSIATGRAHRAIAGLAKTIPMNAPAVLSNGSEVYDFREDKYLLRTYLPSSALEDCLEMMKAVPEIGFEVYHNDGIYAVNPNEITEMHMRRVGAEYALSKPQEIPRPWSKVIFQQKTAVLERVEAYYKTRWPDKYEIIFSNRFLLELTEKNSNKGKMVLFIANRLQIDNAHIYCIGDNKNDIPMLEISAIPFAPSNAAEAVKAMGARVVGSSDEHCIRDIVTILDGVYHEGPRH